MFTTVNEIKNLTGIEVSSENLNLAQMMIETYVGRVEEDVDDASDKALLAQATMFQAIYMEERPDSVLTNAATTMLTQGGAQAVFDTKLFAPFLSPWAAKACSRLTFTRSRSIRTGKVVQRAPYSRSMAWTHDLEV